MWPQINWTVPGKAGLVVFLLLSVAVVSTQAQTVPDQAAIERQPVASGPLVLRVTEFAMQALGSRKATLAIR